MVSASIGIILCTECLYMYTPCMFNTVCHPNKTLTTIPSGWETTGLLRVQHVCLVYTCPNQIFVHSIFLTLTMLAIGNLFHFMMALQEIECFLKSNLHFFFVSTKLCTQFLYTPYLKLVGLAFPQYHIPYYICKVFTAPCVKKRCHNYYINIQLQ